MCMIPVGYRFSRGLPLQSGKRFPQHNILPNINLLELNPPTTPGLSPAGTAVSQGEKGFGITDLIDSDATPLYDEHLFRLTCAGAVTGMPPSAARVSAFSMPAIGLPDHLLLLSTYLNRA
jgi:hypothetical protein